MKFFKPEDFEYDSTDFGEHGKHIRPEFAANRANEKLEREGEILYSFFPEATHFIPNWLRDKKMFSKGIVNRRALLINIEEIKKCEHPKEKVKLIFEPDDISCAFYCECGMRVYPQSFKEIK